MAHSRKLRYGMIGGGSGAFIGAVHRMAAHLDGQMELVAGCFSADPEKSRRSGATLFLPPDRVYASFTEMAQREATLPAERRLDFVSIVTPNHLHAPAAIAFLERGFHVVCDKPMTHTLSDALALREVVQRTGQIFALTHNYTGYPMVKEARDHVRRGDLGPILKIVAEYPQGWLLEQVTVPSEAGARAWRADPAQGGASRCLADIGTHAENLGRYITGLKIESLCADFTTFIPGHPLEDDASLLLRYEGGARGILHASQISCGEDNNLSIRIYGTKGALEWRQEHPNELKFQLRNEPARVLRRDPQYLGPAAQKATRLPAGHPEGFIEGFANVYLEVAVAIRDRLDGRQGDAYDFPTVEDGLIGMAFLETAIRSAASPEKWTPFVKI